MGVTTCLLLPCHFPTANSQTLQRNTVTQSHLLVPTKAPILWNTDRKENHCLGIFFSHLFHKMCQSCYQHTKPENLLRSVCGAQLKIWLVARCSRSLVPPRSPSLNGHNGPSIATTIKVYVVDGFASQCLWNVKILGAFKEALQLIYTCWYLLIEQQPPSIIKQTLQVWQLELRNNCSLSPRQHGSRWEQQCWLQHSN